MKEFKIRCSQIGQIMSKPRAKKDQESGLLSQTTKSYVEEWLKEQIYGVKKEVDNKYTQKGNECELDSLDLFCDYAIIDNFDINYDTKFIENEFLQGTPDAIYNDVVIDLKNSWDCFTFPLFAKEVPNKNYYYQLQGYMHLLGLKKAKLVYVLSDTPAHIIEKEAKFYAYNNGYDVIDGIAEPEVLKKFIDKITYTNIDLK